jgi:DNA repair exonuclease SbcCD ATPase subunit
VDLFVPAGDAGVLVPALPPGPLVSDEGTWSVAYAVDATAACGRLALVPVTGGAVALSPERRQLDPEPQPPAPVPPAEDELAEANALVHQLRRRCELSEKGLKDFRDKLVQAWAEAAEMRNLLDAREKAHAASKELAERRRELEAQCERLEEELDRRGASAARLTEDLRREASEALARFEAARAEADTFSERLAKAERELEEARQLAAAPAPSSEHGAIEADLRHMLAVSQRELEAARAELREQSARYAAVASQAVAPAATDPAAEQPWTAIDEDLLGRIARAKQIAGQD